MHLRAENEANMHFTLPFPTVGRYLVVTCGALHLAVPDAFIKGIHSHDETARLIADAGRGEIYSVVELATRFEQPTPPETSETRILLVGRSETHAFRVETIQGFTEVRSHQRRPLPPQFGAEERHWFGGLFLFRDTIALIVNPHWLLDMKSGCEGEHELSPATIGTEVLELEVACDGDEIPWAEL
jgi:hypothetical protein